MEKELVEYIVRSLVDQPESVEVNVVEGEKSTILELRVSPDDIGKVIGKQGRIAKALRTILSATATKSGKHASLEILD
ncbi:MAG: KH domain-containing protein [Spirochaetales bacterium]|nr:KH domain-containing protein [Spirochaetales bacterium]MCR5443607.1 KH domain-containing protein [Sphaerochaetaceae bacterium]MDT3389238.1 KH domain-containing protein [bacterium]MBO4717366.1 KH domain-containing protein [Spirochaetales bacterium]MBQ3316438.1 KH domain-containing protein [Spirochaetales bacterium]